MMNQPVAQAKLQSKLGIASFVIALATFVLVITATFYMGLLSSGRSQLQDTVATGWAVLFFIIAPLAHLVGIALAIIALFRKDRKKLLAVFGLILNIAFVSIGIFLTLFLLKAAVAFH